MTVWALGLNHVSAPLDLRGRFAFPLDQIVPALHELRARLAHAAGLREACPETALLSTCNRTELYCALPRGVAPDLVHPALDWLATSRGVASDQLQPYTYLLENDTVARHAFRVASGLDSMVLGEAQILGQMKNAVRAAGQAGALGTTLNQLFQRSFAIAKEVRSATEIGAHSISMAAAAVRLAGELFEDLGEINVLFVGAGAMIELVATHFAARHPRHIAIANRTLERGERLGQRLGAEVMRLADLPARLPEFDAVVSCTASTLPIIGLGAVESALKARRHHPIFMVDLAVPRDIEPEVARIADVYLYTLDDLAAVVHSGTEKRQAAVAQAEGIIDAGVQSFMRWLDERSTVPLIQAVNQQAEIWRQAELARAQKAIARGADVQAVLESLSHGLTQKLLHGALAELHGADPALRHQAAATISRLYLRGSTRHHIPAASLRQSEH